MRSGKLVVIEGAEGVGKTTQVRRLCERLAKVAIPALCLREPGGTPLGDEIRHLLLDPAGDVTARAEALLFMASRAQLAERAIVPALREGTNVVLDRYFLATYAYQVAGRGLSEAEVRAANAFATGGLVPDVTLLLEMPVAEALARVERRGEPDRLEQSGRDFHQRVAAAFAAFDDPEWQRQHMESGPVVRLDALGSEEDVEGRIRLALAGRWPETFGVLSESPPR